MHVVVCPLLPLPAGVVGLAGWDRVVEDISNIFPNFGYEPEPGPGSGPGSGPVPGPGTGPGLGSGPGPGPRPGPGPGAGGDTIRGEGWVPFNESWELRYIYIYIYVYIYI